MAPIDDYASAYAEVRGWKTKMIINLLKANAADALCARVREATNHDLFEWTGSHDRSLSEAALAELGRRTAAWGNDPWWC